MFADGRVGGRIALMDMGNRCAIDDQAEQFRPTVVAARVHGRIRGRRRSELSPQAINLQVVAGRGF